MMRSKDSEEQRVEGGGAAERHRTGWVLVTQGDSVEVDGVNERHHKHRSAEPRQYPRHGGYYRNGDEVVSST